MIIINGITIESKEDVKRAVNVTVDFKALYGPIEARRRYIKSRIKSALRASDKEEAANWQKQLKEL